MNRDELEDVIAGPYAVPRPVTDALDEYTREVKAAALREVADHADEYEIDDYDEFKDHLYSMANWYADGEKEVDRG